MNILPNRHLRPLSTLLLAGSLSGAFAFGCAPAQKPPSAASLDAEELRGEAQVKESDAFEVARAWAANLPGESGDAAMPSPEVHSISATWQAAQVARIWAAGDEYRALITERSTAAPGPAVLLYISRDASGAWKVQAIKPSTSTALWSQF